MKIQGINVIFLYVHDIAASRDFYTGVLGMGQPIVDEANWVEWKLGNGSNLAICRGSRERMEGSIPERSRVKFSLVVDDIEEAHNDLIARGVEGDIREGPGFYFIDFRDPDDNVLRLLQWARKT